MFIFILILIVIGVIACNVVIVPEASEYVVERLGSYYTTWGNGLHVKIPFIDRVANQVSLKEQVCDFKPSSVITKDNVTMQIDTVVYFKVFDSKLYTYGVSDPIAAIELLNATTLRNIIGGLDLDSCLVSRDTINSLMQTTLDKPTDNWGVRVERVELKNIIPPAEVKMAMEKQVVSERIRRQTVTEAAAHKEAAITRAEGDKEAKIMAAEAEKESQIALAEGKARSIELVYEAEAKGLEALRESNINDNVLKLKGLEALKDVANGRATKIYMPTDLSGVITSLGTISEGMGIGDATPIDKSPRPVEKPASDDCCESAEMTPQTKELSEEYAQSRTLNDKSENIF